MKSIVLILFVMCSLPVFSTTYPEGNNNYCNRLANAGDYLWIASNQGLIRYEKATGKCESYTEKVGYDNSSIFTCVYTDKEDNLWFGTRGDYLCKYNEDYLKKYIAHSFSPFCWFSIAFDANDDPWTGSVLLFYNYKNTDNTYIKYGSIHVMGSTSFIMDMEFDSKGNLWMAADTSLFNYHYLVCKKKDSSGLDFILSGLQAATSLAVDSQDNIWLVCDDGIHYYNPTSQTDTHYTSENTPSIADVAYTACEIDNQGNVWFIASDHLLKYDGTQFAHYKCSELDEARSILCDNGVVWIYTNNDDLFRLEKGEFTRVHIETPTSDITSVEDDPNKLIVACDKNGNIRISSDTELTGIRIYTVSGTLVLSQLSNGTNEFVLENFKLSKGIYLVKVSHSGGEFVSKVAV